MSRAGGEQRDAGRLFDLALGPSTATAAAPSSVRGAARTDDVGDLIHGVAVRRRHEEHSQLGRRPNLLQHLGDVHRRPPRVGVLRQR